MKIPGYKPTPQDVEEMSRLIRENNSGGGGTNGVNNRGGSNQSLLFCSGCRRVLGILGRVVLGIVTMGVSELIRLGLETLDRYQARHGSSNGPKVKQAPFNGQPFQ